MNNQSPIEYEETILFNTEYFDALLIDINKAKISIDLETYIFADDEIGNKIIDALGKAVKRGVKVRILVDGVGTLLWNDAIKIKMQNANIPSRVFHPVPWLLKYANEGKKKSILKIIFNLFAKINKRNHRKTCIIDSTIVYVGSANIILDYIDESNEKNKVRDTTVKLTNVDTSEVEFAFNLAWGDISLRNKLRHIFIRTSSQNPFLLNYSWKRKYISHQTMLKQIRTSKSRIWIENAYFVPNNRVLKSLLHAAKNNVDIKIILPSKYDVLTLSLVTKTFYVMLLEAGVEIYEYLPCQLHSKTLIIDNVFYVGSTNFNHRSFEHDLEIDVTIQSNEAKKILENQFLLDLSQSQQIKNVSHISIFSKIIGRFLLLLKYWM